MNIEFKIEGDKDGYIELECPFCESEFRLKSGVLQNDDILYSELYCPYCGLVDDANSFYTKEVIEKITELAQNYMFDQLNKSFGNMAKKMNQSKTIKMTWKPLKKINVQEIKTEDSVEEEFSCGNCDNHLKVLYCAGVSKIFCSYRCLSIKLS